MKRMENKYPHAASLALSYVRAISPCESESAFGAFMDAFGSFVKHCGVVTRLGVRRYSTCLF